MTKTTSPEPLTLERVEQALTGLNLKFLTTNHLDDTPVPLERTTIATGFENFSMFIDLLDSTLRARSAWRGEPAAETAPEVLRLCNDYNLQAPAPAVSFSTGAHDTLVVTMHQFHSAPAGATDEQIVSAVTAMIRWAMQACHTLETTFPELVNWSTNHG